MERFPEPASPIREPADDELEAYATDGVICARRTLDPDAIVGMRQAIEDVLRNDPALGARSAEFAEVGFQANDFAWKTNDDFRALPLFPRRPRLAQRKEIQTPFLRPRRHIMGLRISWALNFPSARSARRALP